MMFRKMSISLLVAVMAILVFAVAVSAQGRWDGSSPNDGVGMRGMRAWQQQNGETTTTPGYMNRADDGTCANFVDEDGDGVCDNVGTQMGMGSMRGRGLNPGMGTGMGRGVAGHLHHRFGDGTCDYGTPPRDGTGQQNGPQE